MYENLKKSKTKSEVLKLKNEGFYLLSLNRENWIDSRDIGKR